MPRRQESMFRFQLSARRALMLGSLLVSGCTYTATGTAPGSITIHRPGTVPPLAQAAPSPAPAPAPAAPAPRDGRYAGTGTLMTDPGGRNRCSATIPITGFVVTGNRVAFRGARGTIGPGGRLDMQAGHRFLSGRFVASRFEGRWWQPPPGCAYWLVLDPVG